MIVHALSNIHGFYGCSCNKSLVHPYRKTSSYATVVTQQCSTSHTGDEDITFSMQIKKFGRPNWRRLVEAVGDHEGGNNHNLAETIAQNHPGW